MFRAFPSPSSGESSAAVYVLLLGSCSALLFVCVRLLCGLVRCGDYRVLAEDSPDDGLGKARNM